MLLSTCTNSVPAPCVTTTDSSCLILAHHTPYCITITACRILWYSVATPLLPRRRISRARSTAWSNISRCQVILRELTHATSGLLNPLLATAPLMRYNRSLFHRCPIWLPTQLCNASHNKHPWSSFFHLLFLSLSFCRRACRSQGMLDFPRALLFSFAIPQFRGPTDV